MTDLISFSRHVWVKGDYVVWTVLSANMKNINLEPARDVTVANPKYHTCRHA